MNIEIDKAIEIKKIVTDNEINIYADLCEDHNPIHLNDCIAQKYGFKKRVVHGMLTGGFISAIIGNILPGEGAIYLEQDLKFLKPVYSGEECTVCVRVSDVLNETKGVYKLDTKVIDSEGNLTVDGFAIVKYQEK